MIFECRVLEGFEENTPGPRLDFLRLFSGGGARAHFPNSGW